MNCLEFQELLQKRLDGQPAASEAMDQHVSECATCRDQVTAAMLLLDGLKRMPLPKTPADFARTLTAQVMTDRRQRQAKMRRRLVLTVALAASVLLMLVIAYSWMPRTLPTAPGGNDPIVNQGQKKKDKKDNEPRPEEKHAKKTEPRHPLTALTDQVADTTRDHARVVIAATHLDAVEKLPMKDFPVDPEVTDRLRLMTNQTRRAFDFFARELPMPDAVVKAD